MSEIHFKQHWKTIGLAFIVVLGFEAISIPVQINLWKTGDYFGILFIHFVSLLFLIGFLYPFYFNRRIIFYDEGISFIYRFQRRFVKWREFQEIRNVSINQHPIILLKSSDAKVKIHLSEYIEKEGVIDFLNEKLSRAI